MKNRSLMFAALASVALGGSAVRPAHADAVATVHIPLFGRIISFVMPSGFTPQPAQSNGKQYLLEILPNGQTFANWTRLITVRGLVGFGAQPATSDQIARAIFEPRNCPAGKIYENDGEQSLGGTLRVSYLAIGCGKTPGSAYPGAVDGGGEVDIIAMYRDSTNIYSLNYAVRGPAFGNTQTLLDTKHKAATLKAALGPYSLCTAGNDPACPGKP